MFLFSQNYMENTVNEDDKRATYVRELASRLNFTCEIFYHKESGESTQDAQKALGIDPQYIIKCLLLKSKQDEYVAAIVRGSDRLNFKAVEHLTGYKGLRMAQPDDIAHILGFERGGVPALIFQEKGIQAFVDNRVLGLEYVVGSGGTPFHGMRFDPRQLTNTLNYTAADIIKEETQ